MIFFGFGLVFFGVFVFLWSWLESRLIKVVRHTVSVKKKLGRPLKILHLSDIHFANPDKVMDRFFDKLAREQVDFVFMTGDIFDAECGIPEAVKNLSKLKPKHGAFAVFGNHDYYDYRLLDIGTMGFRGRRHPDTLQPTECFKQVLEKIGIRVLINQEFEMPAVESGMPGIVIHGLDDPTTGRADIERALKNDDPAKVHVLLTHTIDAFFYIGEGEVDLSLSGHSHGGQIRFPLVGPLITHTQYGPSYADGIKYLKGAVCCVSRGVGASRYFSLRLLCRPEAILLTVTGE